jgi:hypothetical protein
MHTSPQSGAGFYLLFAVFVVLIGLVSLAFPAVLLMRVLDRRANRNSN